ncbi:MAG TPA: ABC transporter permease [Planctomycetota bacterium]|nr:ABC transporter permease [Planctomycetota bacterium]
MTAPGVLLTVYMKETRSLLRDGHVVIYSVLLPLFLYPALVWGVIQVVAYSRGMEERRTSKVVLHAGPEVDDALRFLEEKPRLELVVAGRADSAAAAHLVRSGDTDLALDLEAGPGEALTARIRFSAARDGSILARERLERALEDYRQERLLLAARSVGEGDDFIEVVPVEEKDHATPQEIANHVASMILPLLMVVMAAMSALYPALDATVGEKERGTLETTLLSPVSRSSLVGGKYLSVVTFSLAGFLLNFASMGLTLAHLGSQLGLERLEVGAWPALVIAAGGVILALTLSAVMMALGFLARSFKEGQTYVMPVYILSTVPAVFTAAPDVSLTPVLAAVPVLNLSLLFREALVGRFSGWGAVLTIAFSALYAALALAIAVRLVRPEGVITGMTQGLRPALRLLFARRGPS